MASYVAQPAAGGHPTCTRTAHTCSLPTLATSRVVARGWASRTAAQDPAASGNVSPPLSLLTRPVLRQLLPRLVGCRRTTRSSRRPPCLSSSKRSSLASPRPRSSAATTQAAGGRALPISCWWYPRREFEPPTLWFVATGGSSLPVAARPAPSGGVRRASRRFPSRSPVSRCNSHRDSHLWDPPGFGTAPPVSTAHQARRLVAAAGPRPPPGQAPAGRGRLSGPSGAAPPVPVEPWPVGRPHAYVKWVWALRRSWWRR